MHQKHLDIRPENVFPQVFVKNPDFLPVHRRSPSFLKEEKRLFSNAFREYFSACLGMSMKKKQPFISFSVFLKASLSNLLMRLRFTLLPCFLLTHSPILVSFAGKYNTIKAGEKSFFPLANNLRKSLFFFNLVYKTHLF